MPSYCTLGFAVRIREVTVHNLVNSVILQIRKLKLREFRKYIESFLTLPSALFISLSLKVKK